MESNQEKKAGGPTPSCDPQQYEVTSGGNVGLKEEKSISYSAGVIFQPNRNFNIGMDLWLTKLSNVVGIDYEDAMLAESKGIDLAKSGVIVNRDTNGYIQSIEAPLQNLSSQDVQGVDMSMDARMGKFKLGVEYSYLLYFKEEGFPGAGKRDKLGENGRPGWRNSVSLGFVPSERQDISLIATTISGHNKAVKEEGRLPAYTSLDMQYNFKMRKMGVITLGAKNILGKTPPIDDTNISRPLDTTLYDQIGTQIYTAYRAGF